MHVISHPSRNEIAKRAYFYFLERRQLGLPDDPQEDWAKAENDLQQNGATFAEEPEGMRKSVPLTLIKGIGPRVAASLKDCGVEDANTLAEWTLKKFGERLPRLTARARNGEWIEQARKLTQ